MHYQKQILAGSTAIKRQETVAGDIKVAVFKIFMSQSTHLISLDDKVELQ